MQLSGKFCTSYDIFFYILGCACKSQIIGKGGELVWVDTFEVFDSQRRLRASRAASEGSCD